MGEERSPGRCHGDCALIRPCTQLSTDEENCFGMVASRKLTINELWDFASGPARALKHTGEYCILQKPPILIAQSAAPTTFGWPPVQQELPRFSEASFWTVTRLFPVCEHSNEVFHGSTTSKSCFLTRSCFYPALGKYFRLAAVGKAVRSGWRCSRQYGRTSYIRVLF